MPKVFHKEEWDIELVDGDGDGDGAGPAGCWPISREDDGTRRRDAKLPDRSKPDENT